ncbi:MAG TPA: hypothetical protein VGA64_03025 [Candidatus Polarisedimenticolia bacterium]
MNEASTTNRHPAALARASLPWLVVTLLGSLACANGDARIGAIAIPPAGAPVSFSHDVQLVFDARGCTMTGCHGAPVFSPMSLEAGQSYANLFNVAACEAPALKRVDPTKSAMSYLIAKLDGSFATVQSNGACSAACVSGDIAYTTPGSCGAQMPLALTPLDNSEIQLIRDWIDQGAQNN